MKPNLENMLTHIKDQSLKLKPQGGLSRGNLLKLGYEWWETTTSKSPNKEEKESIRDSIQKDLNTLAFRQDYEVLVSDKPFRRLTGGGELVLGRNLKLVDTRQQSLERQVKEIWGMISEHQAKKAKDPLYEGTEAEETKTRRLANNLYARLYQLEESEFKTRVALQMEKWFPSVKSPEISVQTQIASIA